MPITAHLNTDLNLFFVKCSGAVSDAEIYAVHAERERLVGALTSIDELVDARDLSSVRGVTRHSLLAGSQRESGKAWAMGGRLVIVVSALHIYGLARVYSALSTSVRAKVMVTRSLDDAIAWLDYREERLERLRAFLRGCEAAHGKAAAPEANLACC